MSSAQSLLITRQSPGGVGKGNVKKPVQQEVTAIATYDLNAKMVHKKDASVGAAYATRDGSLVYDVMDSEPLYTDLSVPHSNPHGESYVLSSLNGAGRAAATSFPGDIEMQRLAIKHNIAPRGFAVGNHKEDSTGQLKITSQVGGTISVWFDEDIPEGSLVALDIPSKEELNNPLAAKKPSGAPAEKALCKVVAYQPKNIGNGFATHITNILARPQEYASIMKSENKYNSLSEAGKAIFDSQLVTAVVTIYHTSIIAGNTVQVSTAAAKEAAIGFGLVSNDGSVNITPQRAQELKELKDRILQSANWNGNRQSAIGGLAQGTAPGSSLGQLVQKQYTQWKKAIEAYNQFIYEDSRLVVGKAVEGALSKHRGVVLISL